MYLRDIEITKLSEPVKADLVFCPKIAGHPELSCLRELVITKRVFVEILGFCDTPFGRSLLFRPEKMPGVKRFALEPYFEIDKSQPGLPIYDNSFLWFK